jgi:hypothetical protein
MNRWKWILVALLIVVFVPFVVVFTKEALQPDVRGLSLRYLSGTEGASVLTGHVPASAIEGWSERKGEPGGTVYIRGSKAELEKAREVLARYDVAAPQVALKFQIIEADGFSESDSAIAPVESALRSLFRFKGYRMAAEAFLLAKSNTEAQQAIAGPDGVEYAIIVRVGDVLRREGKASAELEARLMADHDQVLGTSVNVPDGQTVVLGTARPDAKRAALILVVTPEIK